MAMMSRLATGPARSTWRCRASHCCRLPKLALASMKLLAGWPAEGAAAMGLGWAGTLPPAPLNTTVIRPV